MKNTLAVALPDGAPKLTRAQVLRATAEALDDKNHREWKAAVVARDAARLKLNKQAEKLARAQLKTAKVEVREGWQQSEYTVRFEVEIPKSDLLAEVDALNACPLVKRITFDDYLCTLRKKAEHIADGAIVALLSDPSIRKRFEEAGAALMGADDSKKAIEA